MALLGICLKYITGAKAATVSIYLLLSWRSCEDLEVKPDLLLYFPLSNIWLKGEGRHLGYGDLVEEYLGRYG